MQNLFLVKVRYARIDEKSGSERKVTESYLLDAVSFTEAEARINEEMKEIINGEFLIVSIARANFSEIFTDSEGSIWYKAKIKFVSIDDQSGREKKISNNILIMADNVDEAYKNINEAMNGFTVDFEIEGITDSKIYDFFPYITKE